MDKKQVVVVGLDPSSRKIAMAITKDGKMVLRTKPLAQGGDIALVCLACFRYVRTTVKEFTEKGYKVVVFLEAPVVGRGGAYSTIRQAQAGGAMMAGALSGGAELHLVNNQVWKKSVIGKGNAGKPDIKKWASQTWPALTAAAMGDQDLIDAGCIMKYGLDRVALAQRLEEAEDMSQIETVRRKK